MQYMDVKTASVRWNLTERRITALCREGRIEGAKKEGGIWLIPNQADKPADGRRSRAASVLAESARLPLPIGISDYKELTSSYYYVDKTPMIREFLDTRPKVSLFTRPRRFGKTLAMDMLKTFFEISEEDTSVYFKNRKIWNCGKRYRKEQGKYPVISVSFKDIKFPTWEQTLEGLRTVIAEEFRRHEEVLKNESCSEYDRRYFLSILDSSVSEVGLSGAFRVLSDLLRRTYEQPVVILVDEYDTPIQQGYASGYYEQIIQFMRNLLSGAFKDNGNLAFGFMTGILRVAKESIFSGLNNIAIHSILENRYSEYFGFTAEEVQAMAHYYGCEEKFDEICLWYDGYCFGGQDIFNPWSVINYFYYECEPRAYWQSTGDNGIIRQIVSEAGESTAGELRKLMQGETVVSYVDISVIYPEIQSDSSTIYSFLLAAGYLKAVKRGAGYDSSFVCELAIPNREISFVYEKEILSALSDVIPPSSAVRIQQAILTQDISGLQNELQEFLIHTMSSFDYAHENFYHGLLLGICAIMNNRYRVDSNRESGHGRYDIQLCPYDKKLPGILIELKVLQEDVRDDRIPDALEQAAGEALDQIERKAYDTAMRQEGVTSFLKIGGAFYKKQVRIQSRME